MSLHYSSINFARSIAGNIGAPLEHIGLEFKFEDPPNEQSGVEELHQLEDDPLSIGILDGAPVAGPRYASVD